MNRTNLLLYFLLAFPFILINNLMAQKNIVGVYELRGFHEMASGFKFDPDNTFEFYYVYGAVDRMAKGRYELDGDTIKLQSQKVPGQDFEIKNQKKQGSGFRLTFTAPNVYLLSHIKVVVVNGSNKTEYETNKEGIVTMPENKGDKIYAQHQLFPDIVTLIKDDSNENNQFELALKPSLAEVSFKGIDLFIHDNELSMHPNYFMPYDNIVYRKSE